MASEKRQKDRPKFEPKARDKPSPPPPENPPLFDRLYTAQGPTSEQVHKQLCHDFRAVCERLVSAAAAAGGTVPLDCSLLGGLDSKVDKLKEALEHAVSTFTEQQRKKFVKDQLRLWHPDKFDQKFSKLIASDVESVKISEFFKAVSSILNDLGRD